MNDRDSLRAVRARGTGLRPALCGAIVERSTPEAEARLALSALRQHDYGLTVESFEFNDDSEKATS
jgi:hypothetical protein